MTQIEIRRVQGNELLTTYFPLIEYAFRESPAEVSEEKRIQALQYEREKYCLFLFEDGQPMASATSIPMTQNVRGQLFPMGGVAGVASYPQARRKGYAYQLMVSLFEEMQRQGQAFSMLYPFRESFYQRLGYVNLPPARTVSLNLAHLTALLKQDLPGEIEIMLIKDGFETYRAFLKEMQSKTHGMAHKPPDLARRMKENQFWVALAQHNDEIVGVMQYHIAGFHKELRVRDFLYKTSAGKYLMLQWLARHVDQVSELWMNLKADDWVETWLPDLKVNIHAVHTVSPMKMLAPMGRVLKVEKIGGMQVGAGDFSAHITDDYCPWNNGNYHFSSDGGKLTVTRCDHAECELSIQGLSALVLGGYDPADFEFRGWGNPDETVQQKNANLISASTAVFIRIVLAQL